MKLIRKMDTVESRRFWRNLERAVAAAKRRWPPELKREVAEWYREQESLPSPRSPT
jgi:hypothetical protein